MSDIFLDESDSAANGGGRDVFLDEGELPAPTSGINWDDVESASDPMKETAPTSGLMTYGGMSVDDARASAALNDELKNESSFAQDLEEHRSNLPDQNTVASKTGRYVGDLIDSVGAGLLKGLGKITEGAGRATGIDYLRRSGQSAQRWVDENVPTQMLDTSGDGVLNTILQTGKNVASVGGEFAPALMPGAGPAYANALIASGAVNRADQVRETAKANGMSDAQAQMLGLGAGTADALWNMLLMGKFKGVWKGAEKTAADAVKQNFVRKFVADTLKTGGIMGGQGATNELIDEISRGEKVDLGKIGGAAAHQTLEGMLFHVLNTGVHGFVNVVDWRTPARSVAADRARRALASPEGRALIYANSPEAAERILRARQEGRDVSQEMLREVGIPKDAVPTQADCNAIADACLNDFAVIQQAVDTAYPGRQQEASREAEARREMSAANAAEGERRAEQMLTQGEAQSQQRAQNELTERQKATDRRKAADSMMLDFESYKKLYADGKTDLSFDEWRAAGKPGATETDRSEVVAPKSRSGEAMPSPEPTKPTGETNETRTGADEAPAQPEQAEAVVPPARAEARPVEGSEASAEAADARVVAQPAVWPNGWDNAEEEIKGYVVPNDSDVAPGREVAIAHRSGGSINAPQKIKGVVESVDGDKVKVYYRDGMGYDQHDTFKKSELVGVMPLTAVPTEGVTSQTAQNRAGVAQERAGARPASETTTTTPAPAKPAEAPSRTSGAEPAVSAPAPAPATQTQTNIPNEKKSPAQESASPSATWTDRGGTTHKLDGFDPPSADNITKGRTVAIRHDNGVLYSGELVGVGPKNVKIKTQSDMYGEQVLTFPKADVVGVKSNRLRRADGTDPLAEREQAAAQSSAAPAPTGAEPPAPVSRTVRNNLVNKRLRPILDLVRNEDGSFNPDALRNHDVNNGLPLKDLKLLNEHPEIIDDLGLPAEDAAALKSALTEAYNTQRVATPNSKEGKVSEAGQFNYSVSASKALERLAKHPNNLKSLVIAQQQVSAAYTTAKEKGDAQGAKFWENRLVALNEQIGKLPAGEQAKIQGILDSLNSTKSAMERKDTQSLESGEGKTLDVADGGAADAEAPAAPAPKGGATGRGGTLGGNRHLIIDGVKGDELTVTMKDAAGKTLATRKMNRAQWSALSQGAVAMDGDPANPQKGDLIRMSRNGESPAERDLRFASDENYQKWLKSRKANDAEPLRERYEREGAKLASERGKQFLRDAKMELHLDREYDPEVDGDGRTIEDPDSGRVVGTFNRETNELKLFRGATIKTLVHELGGHATLKYAEQLAKQGDSRLIDRINKVIDEAPQEIKDEIRKRYTQGEKESAEAYEARLRDEVWAAVRERNSPAMERAIKTLQGKAWYNRAWQTLKDAWKGLLSSMGFNRADLSKVDKMSNEEFLKFLDETMAEGKTLGKLEKGGATGTRERVTDPMLQGIVDNLKEYKGKVKFSDFTKRVVEILALGDKGRPLILELPDFDKTKVVISSPSQAQTGEHTTGIDHSAFNHNWETGTAYSGRYTWPEFNEAFKPENLRRGVKSPDAVPGREKFIWKVKYPAEEGRKPYELTWRLVREKNSGNLVNVFTERGESDYPPTTKASPEGAHLGNTHANGVADASSSGDRRSISNSSADGNGDVREARAPKPAGYKIMDDVQTKGEKFKERFIDRYAPVQSVQDEIGGVKEVVGADGYTDHKKSTDYVAAADKSNGRVEYELRDLQHKSDEISKDLAKAALKGESSAELESDFDLYLQCKHAAERNRTIAERNGVTYDPDYYYGMGKVERGGTKVGLSENVANDILADMARKYGSLDAFDKAAQKVYEINRADIQRRVEAGRLTVQDANQYLYRWQNYVPLKTDMERLEPDAFNSSTASMRRNEFRKARGRADADIADSPLAASILQAEQGIRGSVKNETLNVLANLVRHAEAEGKPIAEIVEGKDMPQGAGWTFEFGDGSRAVAGGEMKLAGNHPEIILFKEDGKLKAIRFEKGANGRGLAVAKSASGENMGKWGGGTEWIPRFTHWMSAMRTQYSPEFTVSNLLADHLEAYQALVGRYGIRGGTAAFGKMVASEIQNAKDLKNYLKTGMMSRDVGEAIRGGLLTKGGVASEGFEGKEQGIRDRIEDFRRKQKTWRNMSATDWAKSGWDNVRDFLSFANEMAEYSTRMGIFSALKKQGVPVKDAVKFARDATVNFNRKGTAMPYINGLYMFANASVQGAVRSVQAMKDTHGKELVALLTAVGVAKAVIDNYLGNDDEREKKGGRNARNLSEYDRKHNVGVPIPGTEMQFVPLRFRGPYAAIPYLAQTAANVAMGNKSAKDGALALVRELGDQVTDVVGGNGIMNDKGELDGSLIMQSLAPSVADPLVQLATGKDYKGDDRKARAFDKTTPASSNGKRSTSEVYKAAARGLNWITGGNEFRKGLVDIAPEDLQLVAEFIGGGPMRDVNNTVSTVKNVAQLATGGTPERTLSQVPFVRRVVKEYPESTSRYYDAIDAYERDKAEFKKTTDLKRRAEFGREHPYVRPMVVDGKVQGKSRVDVLNERIKELTHLERGEVKNGQKWVERRTPLTEEQKESFRKRRLELQAKVLDILGR